MPAKVLDIIVRLKDEVSQKTSGLRDKIKGIGNQFLDIKNIIVGGVVGIAFKQLYNAYAEQEEATTKLQAALRATGQFSEATKETFLAQASALQKLTVFGDEAITSGQAFALSMGMQASQVKEVTPLVLDFASAMNIDLQTAFRIVGQAASGETGLLKRYGIIVDEAELKSRGFAAVQETMEKNFKGTAEAVAKSGIGPMKQFGNMIGDVGEDIMGALMPSLNNIIGVIKEHMPTIQKSGLAIGTILSTILKSVEALAVTVIELVKITVDQVINSIELVAEVFKGFWQILKGDFKGGFQTIKKGVSENTSDILKSYSESLSKVGKTFVEKGNEITVEWEKTGKALAGIADDSQKKQTQSQIDYTEQRKEIIKSETKLTEEELEKIRKAKLEAFEKEVEDWEEELEFRRERGEIELEDIIAFLEKKKEEHQNNADELKIIEDDLASYTHALEAQKVAEYTANKEALTKLFKDGSSDWKAAFSDFGNYVSDIVIRKLIDSFIEAIGLAKLLTSIIQGLKLGAGGIGGFFGGLLAPLFGFQHGGILKEPVAGVGLRSGRNYSFGEAGPERITPVGRGIGEVGISGGISIQNINIQFPNVTSFQDWIDAPDELIKEVTERKILKAFSTLGKEGKVDKIVRTYG